MPVRSWTRRLTIGVIALPVAACRPAEGGAPAGSAYGDAEHGRQLAGSYGCTTCHNIPGAAGGEGPRVPAGPSLAAWGTHTHIAGVLENTPEHLQLWLREPQSIKPGDAMPDLSVSERDARDIAAYLFTRLVP